MAERTLSKEESIEFAAQFELVKIALNGIDWDYAAASVKALREQVGRQQTMAVFNPSYPESKNDLISLQADALATLCSAVKLLKQVDEKKRTVEQDLDLRKTMEALFI